MQMRLELDGRDLVQEHSHQHTCSFFNHDQVWPNLKDLEFQKLPSFRNVDQHGPDSDSEEL